MRDKGSDLRDTKQVGCVSFCTMRGFQQHKGREGGKNEIVFRCSSVQEDVKSLMLVTTKEDGLPRTVEMMWPKVRA